eukprot:TRINITY_DN38067_c0_g1_i3.p1 TRINITY_DN38067_c0_g1~~TRINITY_DN38067_c0_g1_i3.p1  ORF type:complete len:902 (+),score=131.79 TRINITY_DN38067_c0_g1_i3:429-3134(+)
MDLQLWLQQPRLACDVQQVWQPVEYLLRVDTEEAEVKWCEDRSDRCNVCTEPRSSDGTVSNILTGEMEFVEADWWWKGQWWKCKSAEYTCPRLWRWEDEYQGPGLWKWEEWCDYYCDDLRGELPSWASISTTDRSHGQGEGRGAEVPTTAHSQQPQHVDQEWSGRRTTCCSTDAGSLGEDGSRTTSSATSSPAHASTGACHEEGKREVGAVQDKSQGGLRDDGEVARPVQGGGQEAEGAAGRAEEERGDTRRTCCDKCYPTINGCEDCCSQYRCSRPGSHREKSKTRGRGEAQGDHGAERRGVHAADEQHAQYVRSTADRSDAAAGTNTRYCNAATSRVGGERWRRRWRGHPHRHAHRGDEEQERCRAGQRGRGVQENGEAGEDKPGEYGTRQRRGTHPSFRRHSRSNSSVVISNEVKIYEYEEADTSMLQSWRQYPVRMREKKFVQEQIEGSTWTYRPIPEICSGRQNGPARLLTEVDQLTGLEECTKLELEDLHDPFGYDRSEEPNAIHIYTDGSKDDKGVGWAYVVMFNFGHIETSTDYTLEIDGEEKTFQKQQHDRMHGFVYGQLDADMTVYQAEVEAALQAMAWVHSYLESNNHRCKIYIHVDNDACLKVVQLACEEKDDERVRMLMLAVRTCATEIVARHVKAHVQNPWNCMADAAAKMGRRGDSVAATLGHAERWSGHSATTMNMQAVVHARRHGDDTMPPITGSGCDNMPEHHDADVEMVAQSFQRTRQGVKRRRNKMQLKLATYNVLSLRREGRSIMLQRVLAEKQVDIVGIQEARTSGPSKRTSTDYVVLASGHSLPHAHGCELWIRKRMVVNGEEVAFTAKDIHMVDASPRWIIARLKTKHFDYCMVVLHAPHAGHSAEEIEAFWRDVADAMTKGKFDEGETIVLGDYNY